MDFPNDEIWTKCYNPKCCLYECRLLDLNKSTFLVGKVFVFLNHCSLTMLAIVLVSAEKVTGVDTLTSCITWYTFV